MENTFHKSQHFCCLKSLAVDPGWKEIVKLITPINCSHEQCSNVVPRVRLTKKATILLITVILILKKDDLELILFQVVVISKLANHRQNIPLNLRKCFYRKFVILVVSMYKYIFKKALKKIQKKSYLDYCPCTKHFGQCFMSLLIY